MILVLLVSLAVFLWLVVRCYHHGLGGPITYLGGFLMFLCLAIALPLELRPLAQVCAWSAVAWLLLLPVWWIYKATRRRRRERDYDVVVVDTWAKGGR